MTAADIDIDRFVSLTDRLHASSAQVAVPNEPNRTVSASLVHMPSRLKVHFGADGGAQRLAIACEYTDGGAAPGEEVQYLTAQPEGYACAASLEVSKRTGRAHCIILRGLDLSEENVRELIGAIDHASTAFIEKYRPPPLQAANVVGFSKLVIMILPRLVQQLRTQGELQSALETLNRTGEPPDTAAGAALIERMIAKYKRDAEDDPKNARALRAAVALVAYQRDKKAGAALLKTYALGGSFRGEEF